MASREAEIKRRTNPAQRGVGRMFAGILNKVANKSKSEGRASPKPVANTAIDFPASESPLLDEAEPEEVQDDANGVETNELEDLKSELRKLH